MQTKHHNLLISDNRVIINYYLSSETIYRDIKIPNKGKNKNFHIDLDNPSTIIQEPFNDLDGFHLYIARINDWIAYNIPNL